MLTRHRRTSVFVNSWLDMASSWRKSFGWRRRLWAILCVFQAVVQRTSWAHSPKENTLPEIHNLVWTLSPTDGSSVLNSNTLVSKLEYHISRQESVTVGKLVNVISLIEWVVLYVLAHAGLYKFNRLQVLLYNHPRCPTFDINHFLYFVVSRSLQARISSAMLTF